MFLAQVKWFFAFICANFNFYDFWHFNALNQITKYEDLRLSKEDLGEIFRNFVHISIRKNLL